MSHAQYGSVFRSRCNSLLATIDGRSALHYAFCPRSQNPSSTMNRKPDPYGRDATHPYHIPLKG